MLINRLTTLAIKLEADKKMRGKMETLLLRNLLLMMIVGTPLVQSALSVPTVRQTSYELIPTENQYQLRLTLPDGSTRVETVELRGEGTPEEELHIMGTIENQFQLPYGGKSVTIYAAGKDGYVVKYKFEGLTSQVMTMGAPPQVVGINAGALKSAAG